MQPLIAKKELIKNYELKFAHQVAAKVIDKPELSLWMILIPVVFVYYFYKLKKFADGRKAFVANYMITRERTLEEAYLAVETNRKTNLNKIVGMSSAPEDALDAYAQWVKVLAAHYQDLLQAQGREIDALVKAAYKNRTNFLLTLNRLNKVEKHFNSALKPHLQPNIPGADQIIAAIEQWSQKIRRDEATRIFP